MSHLFWRCTLIKRLLASCSLGISIICCLFIPIWGLTTDTSDSSYKDWVKNHPTYQVRQIEEVIAGVRNPETIHDIEIRHASILAAKYSIESEKDVENAFQFLHSYYSKNDLREFLDNESDHAGTTYHQMKDGINISTPCYNDFCKTKEPFTVLNDAKFYYRLKTEGAKAVPLNLDTLPPSLIEKELHPVHVSTWAGFGWLSLYVGFGIYTLVSGLAFHFLKPRNEKENRFPVNVLEWAGFILIFPGWFLVLLLTGNIPAGWRSLRAKLFAKKQPKQLFADTIEQLHALKHGTSDPKLRIKCDELEKEFVKIRVAKELEPIENQLEEIGIFANLNRKE